jgi:uncharacterized membrane protein (DUF2068 family)
MFACWGSFGWRSAPSTRWDRWAFFSRQIMFMATYLARMALRQFHATYLHFILSVVGTFVLAKAVVELIAGWGLLRRESWARMLTLVLAVFALFNYSLRYGSRNLHVMGAVAV